METYWFLDFLGLDTTADRRSIKKSYAVLLKRIDPKEDPEGFAELRQAYEIALEWEENGAFYEIEIGEPSEDLPEPSTIEKNSHLDFSKELASLVIEWDQGVRDISDSVESQHERFSAFLDKTMNDDRLLNFTNRSHFENYLISTYRNPDTPLRAISFLETVRYFNWNDHSSYLEESENGRWVLEILEEQLLWENQDPVDFYWQQIALNSFLQNVKTQKEQQAWQHLVVMARQFPLWFELWIGLDELAAITEKYADQEDPEVVDISSSRDLRGYFIIFFILMVIGNLLRQCSY